MNITKDGLNKVMEQIHTDRDIVTSAKIRAEASGRGKKVKLRPVAAVLCAVMLMCGVTVSAVTLGWTEQLFGESAKLIAENIDKYKVEIGNVKIENAEGVPYSFTVGDVISDGSSLYINLLIGGLDIKSTEDFYFDAHMTSYQSGSGKKWDLLYSGCTLLDIYGNSCIVIDPGCGVGKNDKLRFTIEETTKGSQIPLADISFELFGGVTDMSKTAEVYQTAEFINSYPDENGFDPYKNELFVETVKISPLKFTVKGRLEEYNGKTSAYISKNNVYFILKSGEKTALDQTGFGCNLCRTDDGSYDVTIDKYFSTVLDLENVKAIEIGGITVNI